MIEKGLDEMPKEDEHWDSVYRRVKELEKQGFKLRVSRVALNTVCP